MAKPKVRTGMPSVQLKKGEFFERARARFYDPTFAAVAPEIEKIIEVAWKNYTEYHKSPRIRRAGRAVWSTECVYFAGVSSNSRMLRSANLARSESKPAVASVLLVKSIEHNSAFKRPIRRN